LQNDPAAFDFAQAEVDFYRLQRPKRVRRRRKPARVALGSPEAQ
jgi:hypothetical protein